MIEGLSDLGWHTTYEALCDWSPADDRLAEHGLLVDGRATTSCDVETRLTPDGRRRCQHGLPETIAVGPFVVLHSQVLCRALSIESTRSRLGYTFLLDAETAAGQSWSVVHPDAPTGRIWAISSLRGVVWLQSLESRRPRLAEVAHAVGAAQGRRLVGR